MSSTAKRIIQDALEDLFVLIPGQNATTDILNTCLRQLNLMLESAWIDRSKIFTTSINVYTLTAGVQSYTLGPTGTLGTTRPTEIEIANLVLNTTPSNRLPIRILTDDEWAAIRVRDIPNALPLNLYYDGGFDSNGNATINLWPGPQIAYQLELFTPQQLVEFSDLTTTIKFPPGYEDWMIKTLAMKVWPRVKHAAKGQPDLALIRQQALEALADLRSSNTRIENLRADPAMCGGGGNASNFNYRTGLIK